METTITPLALINLSLLIFCFYLLVQLPIHLMHHHVKNKRLKYELQYFSSKFTQVYKILAVILIFIAAVHVHPFFYAFFLTLMCLLIAQYSKSYYYGLELKKNPLLRPGIHLNCGKHHGFIERFTALGVYLKEGHLKVFVNYSILKKQGFTLDLS